MIELPPESIATLDWLIKSGGTAALTGLGIKFINTIKPAIGEFYKPFGIKREARAEVEAELIKGIGAIENEAIFAVKREEIESAIELRAYERHRLTENERQKNLEDILSIAFEKLPEKGSDEPVDIDWFTRFRITAQDVSNAEMKDLWAKILAGEVAQPNSYSLRTLEVVKNLSKEDAEIFRKVSQSAIVHEGNTFILGYEKFGEVIKKEFNFGYSELIGLREAGLLMPAPLVLEYDFTSSKVSYYFGNKIVETQGRTANKQNFYVEPYTATGSELLPLIEITPNKNYMQTFAEIFDNSSVED